jgi:hypothetical protein
MGSENHLSSDHYQSVSGPIQGGAAVTTHNTNELSTYSRALWIGGSGSGNLKVTLVSGDVITLAGVSVGLLPLRCKIVWATGTDVTNIVALW